MFNPLTLRLLSTCTAALLITACAGDPTGSDRYRTNLNESQPKSQTKSQKSQSSDIWQRVRNGYAMPDLYNTEVTSKENYYAQRADYVGRMASRSGDFMYLIMNEVERRKMPSEIALLPFVESAFVTTAQSPVKAAGLWQFMPATGRDFALQQNHFADQRNDVVASTDAALTFLQRLYDQFGDWHLALAAYNWGPGNVSKAVRRAQASGLSGTYEELKMPTETRQYVPKLQAIKNIVNNPAQYGISLPDISNNARNEVVTVTRDIDVATAARLAGLDVESFKRINPAYKKSVITASLGSKILVPANRADDVRRAFSDNSQTLSSVTTYSTYNLESLDDIASKFNTNSDNLRYLNNIPSGHNYVKAGSALLVPRTSNRSSQDIPYDALTAGLSTTSGDIGLNTGDYIEQPSLVVSNTDETTRQERSGIVNTLNDPLPSSTVLAVRNTPTYAEPVVNKPNTLVLHNSPVVEPKNTQPDIPRQSNTLVLHNSPVIVEPNISAPNHSPQSTTPEDNLALKLFVATVEDVPEVVLPLVVKTAAVKDTVVAKAKPILQVVQKKPTSSSKAIKVVNVASVKAKLIPVKVNETSVSAKKTTSTTKKTTLVAPTSLKPISAKVNQAPIAKKTTVAAPTVNKKTVATKPATKPSVKPIVIDTKKPVKK